jgi:DNA-binding transcriptional MerR regulator
MNSPDIDPVHTLAELCALADLPPRTVRYYVQIGLVDRPQGETRAARYGARHLEQLLLTKKWTAAGLSLERIRELLHRAEAPLPARPRTPGSIEVCSHLFVADGIEVVVEPGRAGLSPEQLRQFLTGALALYGQIAKTNHPNEGEPA